MNRSTPVEKQKQKDKINKSSSNNSVDLKGGQ
jgi:hypothetical protein